MDALFEQAGIKIQNEHDFYLLKSAVERLLGSGELEKFLKKLDSQGVRIRDWEKVLEKGVIDDLDQDVKKSGKTAKQLYGALAVTDQGQMREFYLTRIEEVDPETRKKFHKLFSYY
jgi:hypothetical protein